MSKSLRPRAGDGRALHRCAVIAPGVFEHSLHKLEGRIDLAARARDDDELLSLARASFDGCARLLAHPVDFRPFRTNDEPDVLAS